MEGYYILDRFEGGAAVLETPEGGFAAVPAAALGPAAKEGDLFLRRGGRYLPDPEATARRRAALRARFGGQKPGG